MIGGTRPAELLEVLKAPPRPKGGGIGYFPDAPANVEATSMWCLAAIAHGMGEEVTREVEWLVGSQAPDGSFSLLDGFPGEAPWATAQATILLHRLDRRDSRDKAVGFLRGFRSLTLENRENDPVRLDTTIVGWSWREGTFGWVEPTAWGMLALQACGLGDDPRVVEGRRFLLDRCIPQGGWNYGNRQVYHHELLPFWDTTALALMALHGSPGDERIEQSLKILSRDQQAMESFYSLAWTALALDRFGQDPGPIRGRLLERVLALAPEEKNAAHVALALIALAPHKVLSE